MSGRVVLKGAFGFIGAAFGRALARQGIPFDSITSSSWSTFDADDIDLLIDCAGNSRKYLAEEDPQFDREKNVGEVAENLRRFCPRRYVLLSSSAVYADPGTVATTAEVAEPAPNATTARSTTSSRCRTMSRARSSRRFRSP